MTQAPVDANAACVGPESENAGKVDSCQGNRVTAESLGVSFF